MDDQGKTSASSGSNPGQIWNTSAYAANGRFVATLATPVVSLLSLTPGERILDLGCGDGALTAVFRAAGAQVTGLDASETMAAAARARGLDVHHSSATAMHFDHEFDAIFSNAALHWIPAEEQPAMLLAAFQALRPGGRFVAELGGQGNIAAIRTALRFVLERHQLDAEALAASFFPSPETYRHLLERAGFTVDTIALHPRPTPLPGGPEGMELWLNTFRNGVLDHLPPSDRTTAVSEVVRILRPILSDPAGDWTADYVRLRFRAWKP